VTKEDLEDDDVYEFLRYMQYVCADDEAEYEARDVTFFESSSSAKMRILVTWGKWTTLTLNGTIVFFSLSFFVFSSFLFWL